jgi:hypothetical protein
MRVRCYGLNVLFVIYQYISTKVYVYDKDTLKSHNIQPRLMYIWITDIIDIV